MPGMAAAFGMGVPLAKSKAFNLPFVLPAIHTIASFVPSLLVMIGEVAPPPSPHHSSVIMFGAAMSSLTAKRFPPPLVQGPGVGTELLLATTYVVPPIVAQAAALLIGPPDNFV